MSLFFLTHGGRSKLRCQFLNVIKKKPCKLRLKNNPCVYVSTVSNVSFRIPLILFETGTFLTWGLYYTGHSDWPVNFQGMLLVSASLVWSLWAHNTMPRFLGGLGGSNSLWPVISHAIYQLSYLSAPVLFLCLHNILKMGRVVHWRPGIHCNFGLLDASISSWVKQRVTLTLL